MNFVDTLKILLSGLPSTLFILVLSFIFSSIFGLIISRLYFQNDKILKWIAKIYTELVRGTPPLLMLLLAYYELPKIFQFVGININDWSKYFFAIFGLSFGWGGYMSEAFRSALEAIDQDQIDAAYSVGMKKRDILKEIIIPQSFILALPNIQNLFLGLLKATSLVYVIGIADMYQNAISLSNVHQGVFQLQIFIVLGLLYWLMTLFFDYIFKKYINKHDYIF